MPQFNTDSAAKTIEEEATKQGVNPAVARAILLSENSSLKDGKLYTNPTVDTDTVSPAGAVGITQVMPDTWAGLVKNGLLSASDNPRDPLAQIKAGVAAIKDGANVTKTPTEQAIYYNGGPKALTAYRAGAALPPETDVYVKKFGAHMGLDTTSTPTPTPAGATSTRESYSSSSRSIPTDVAQQLRDAVGQYSGLNAQILPQLQTLMATVLPNAQAQSDAVDAEAKATGDKLTADNDITQAKLQSQNDVLSAFGINLNNPNNIITRNLQISTAAHDQRAALQDQITALSSKSPLSDPVGWLMDTLKAEPLIARHNALLTQENSANNQIVQTQAEATAQAAIQPANISAALNSKNIAEVNLALAQAQEKKAIITGTARASLAQTMLGTLQVASGNVTNIRGLAEMFSTQEGSTYSFKDNGEKERFGLLNAKLATVGLPGVTPETIKTMDRSTADRLTKWGQGFQGTPGDTVSLMYEIAGNNMGAAMKNAPQANAFLQDILGEGQKELEATKATNKINPDPLVRASMARLKTPIDELAFGVDAWSRKMDKEREGGDFTRLSPKNPYKLDVPMVATDARLQDNPVAQAVLASKGQKVDEQWILARMAADVANGKTDAASASRAIADFYSKGTQIQSDVRAMPTIGFKPLNNYPVLTKLYGPTGKVDLMDANAIDHFLTTQIISGKVSGQIQPTTAPVMNTRLPL